MRHRRQTKACFGIKAGKNSGGIGVTAVLSAFLLVACTSPETSMWVPASQARGAPADVTDVPAVAVDGEVAETAGVAAADGAEPEVAPKFVPRTVSTPRDRFPDEPPPTAAVDPSAATQSRDIALRNQYMQNQGRIDQLDRELRDFDTRGPAIGARQPVGVGGTDLRPPALRYRDSIERRNLRGEQRAIRRELNLPTATVNSINSARGHIAAPVGQGSSRALIRR